MSPELALVDSDLAALLRAQLEICEARPRIAAYARHLSLVDGALDDVEVEEASADVGLLAPDDDADDADIVVDLPPERLAPSALEISEESLPDYVIVDSTPTVFVAPASEPSGAAAAESPPVTVVTESVSDYPVLPTLDERSAVLEGSEAALRKIREQLLEQESGTRKRSRRGLMITSGLGALTALALLVIDVQAGVVQLPGW